MEVQDPAEIDGGSELASATLTPMGKGKRARAALPLEVQVGELARAMRVSTGRTETDWAAEMRQVTGLGVTQQVVSLFESATRTMPAAYFYGCIELSRAGLLDLDLPHARAKTWADAQRMMGEIEPGGQSG